VIGWFRSAVLLAASCVSLAAPLGGQIPVALTRERSEFASWLGSAPTSPVAVLAREPIGDGLSLGPAGSDVPLIGLEPHRVLERHGLVTLETRSGRRPMPRGRSVRMGEYTLVVDGSASREVLTVFGAPRTGKVPHYFPYERGLVYEGGLSPPAHGRRVRILALDGNEVEATEAGSVVLPIGGKTTRLRVLRIPLGAGEESDLEIFFRDSTNGQETYPAGRFVSLLPLGGGRYRLDFNRARNPFCAYNSAYPCPAPWRGNAIAAPIRAGERYDGGGLSAPPAEESR
jgi:uncharacterized protein DUF1684